MVVGGPGGHKDPPATQGPDRKSTRLNSSHTVIYTLSLHDALPISGTWLDRRVLLGVSHMRADGSRWTRRSQGPPGNTRPRSEEHTSELQSHSDLHSFPTRRSSDLRHLARPSSTARRESYAC